MQPGKFAIDCAEDDRLLSLHVVNNPSKVGELPTLDAVTEDTEQKLDLRRRLDRRMV